MNNWEFLEHIIEKADRQIEITMNGHLCYYQSLEEALDESNIIGESRKQFLKTGNLYDFCYLETNNITHWIHGSSFGNLMQNVYDYFDQSLEFKTKFLNNIELQAYQLPSSVEESLFIEIGKRCKASVHLDINPHKSFYYINQEYPNGRFSCPPDNYLDIVSSPFDLTEDDINIEKRKKMLEENKIISLQFYDRTPVSFYRIYGIDCKEIFLEAIDILNNN